MLAATNSHYPLTVCHQLPHLLWVVFIGRIRDGVAALRKILAGAGYRVASCECGSSDDQKQSDKSSHEQFPLSLMQVRWPFGHECVPDVRILVAGVQQQKQLPDTCGLGYDRSLKRFCRV